MIPCEHGVEGPCADCAWEQAEAEYLDARVQDATAEEQYARYIDAGHSSWDDNGYYEGAH